MAQGKRGVAGLRDRINAGGRFALVSHHPESIGRESGLTSVHRR